MSGQKIIDGLKEAIEFVKNSEPVIKPAWKDPECPKCGLKLGNNMMYRCPNDFCPCGLN